MRFSKALLALAVMLAATVVLSGCCCALASRVATGSGALPGQRVVGSRTMVTRSYDVSGFTGIDAGATFSVEIVPSSGYEVKVTTNENILPYVEVQVTGDTLGLGLKPGYSFTNLDLEVRVALPVLESVKLTGASSAKLAGEWKADRFAADVSGASRAEGSMVAERVDLDLSGSSRIRLDGSAARLEVDSSGASNLELGGFVAKDASVSLGGASKCVVDVTGKLDARLSGASRLEYGGSPVLGNVDVSGGSTLRAR